MPDMATQRGRMRQQASEVSPIGTDADPFAPGVSRKPSHWRGVGIALAGLGLGLGATALTIQREWDPGRQMFGAWSRERPVESSASDPYRRALLAETGELSLAPNEGVLFKAQRDDSGFQLLRSCSYRVDGPLTQARIWTLAAIDQNGFVIDNPAHRYGFTSANVLRDLSGEFSIEIGPEARSGNWLPTSGRGSMTLDLRLYDTPIDDREGGSSALVLPSILRHSCAAP